MRPWQMISVAVAVGAGMFGLIRLHRQTLRLEADLAGLKRSTATHGEASEGDALRAENRRLSTLLAQTRRGEGKSLEAIHAELVQARSEVAGLERRAQASAENSAQHPAAAAENRDPEKGFARLEYFQNAGRTTPVAALQTIVWAALHGDSPALVEALALTDTARQEAGELLAGLPAETRRKYPRAESLAALVVAGEIVDTTAVRIAGVRFTDAEHATVDVLRLQAADQALSVRMALGPGGWRMEVSERIIDTLKQRMSETNSPLLKP